MNACSIPTVLAAVVAAVPLYGLGGLLLENIRVAPEAKEAAEHRLTPHLKNVIRFLGSSEEIGREVHRAVVLDEEPPARAPMHARFVPLDDRPTEHAIYHLRVLGFALLGAPMALGGLTGGLIALFRLPPAHGGEHGSGH